MTVPKKILLINMALAIALSILLGIAFSQNVKDFTVMYGVVAAFGGFLDLVIGLLLLFKTDKRFAQGFLLSGAVLMVTGFLTCSFNF